MSLVNYELKNFKRLLNTSEKIFVPFFQRPYSWNKNEYLTFIEDLKRVYDNNSETYFLGSIFFREKEKNSIVIIDGQQRITTVTILICLIRDILFEYADDRVNLIETEYLQKTALKTRDSFYKLNLSDINFEFFQKYIQKKEKPSIKLSFIKNESNVNDSNILLSECYKNYYQLITKWTKDYDHLQKIEFIIDLLEALSERFQVLSITVTDETEAFTIFETLNDRGLDLTIADLLKNYLFSILHSKVNENQLRLLVNKWDSMIETLGKNISSFLKHYWNSKNKPISEKEIYRVLKGRIRTKSEVLQFLDDINKESAIYNQFLNPEHAYWNNKEIEKSLKEISTLGLRQCFPLLLSSKLYLKDEEFLKVVNSCLSLSFKYSTVCNLHNNILENHYSAIANKIRDKEINEAKAVRKGLKTLEPKEEVFNELFRNLSFKGTKAPKYILKKINDSIDSGREIVSSDEVTLEHIIPENPIDEYKEYFVKNKIVHKDVIYKLSNMTLLGEEYNRLASSKMFVDKKHMYKKSKLTINDKLKEYDQWDLTSMYSWCDYLLQKAKDVWKV